MRSKGKIDTVCAMKAHTGRTGTPPLILNLSTTWRWAFQQLQPRQRTMVPAETRVWVGPTAGPDVVKKRKISCPSWEQCLRPSFRPSLPQPCNYSDWPIPDLFPRQQWLGDRASLLCYSTLPVFLICVHEHL